MNLHRQVLRGVVATIIGLALIGVELFETVMHVPGAAP